MTTTRFEERFGQILDIADREYDYEPPSKYYKNGFNLKKRLREFREAHLLFLHDKNVPADNKEQSVFSEYSSENRDKSYLSEALILSITCVKA